MNRKEKRSAEGLIDSIFHENYDRAVELASEMQKKTNELKEKLISALMDFGDHAPLRSRKDRLQRLFTQMKTYHVEDLRRIATEAGNKAFGKILSIPSDDERIGVISRIVALADISRLNTLEIRNLINQIKTSIGGGAEKKKSRPEEDGAAESGAGK